MVTQRALVTTLLLIGMLLFITIQAKPDDNDCCTLSQVKTLGTGQVSVDADIAIIYAYVMKDGATVAEALSNAQAVLNAIDTVLAQNKLPKSSIQTSYLSIYPKYDYTTGTGVINGYTVYISLTITIKAINKDPKRVGTVIEGLANAGVSSVSGITYDVEDKDKYATLARKSAFASALKKAKEYADIVRGKLGRILKVDQSGLTYYPYYTSSTLGNATASGTLGQSYGGNGGAIAGLNTNPSTPNIQLPLGKVSVVVNVVVTWVLLFV